MGDTEDESTETSFLHTYSKKTLTGTHKSSFYIKWFWKKYREKFFRVTNDNINKDVSEYLIYIAIDNNAINIFQQKLTFKLITEMKKNGAI